MRPIMVLGPLLVVSMALFVAAAFARSGAQALMLATFGALLPAVGLGVIALQNIMRWRRMGSTLGLVAREPGPYPDLEGRYQGRRLVIIRRTSTYGIGPRLTTVVRLEGTPEVRLPGLVADPETIKHILEPLLSGPRGPEGAAKPGAAG